MDSKASTSSSLLLPQQSGSADQLYRFHRPTKKSDYVPVPHRWYTVLALHLSGKKASEIKEETGYSIAMVHRILAHKGVVALRQQLLDSTQQEFEALFGSIVDNIREQLESSDPVVRLAVQNQWLRANGKFANGAKANIINNITAEQVVQQILENGGE